MSKQTLVFLLAIIIGLFTYAGYRNVIVTDSEIAIELQKTNNLTHELGIAYVWYDITVVDIMKKYAAGHMDMEEMTIAIANGKAECHAHLSTYAKSYKSFESHDMFIINSQDSIINEAINNIIDGPIDNTSLDTKITALYNSTRPILEVINNIITIRSRYINCLNDSIQKDNEHIRGYLINTWVMSLVLFIASFMKLKNIDTPHVSVKSHKSII